VEVVAGHPGKTDVLRYEWKASSGKFTDPTKSQTEWNPNGADEGSYALSVTITSPDNATGSCSFVMLVGKATRGGSDTGITREIRSAMLLPDEREEPQYGLYSYMLLGSRITDANRKRYEAFLTAFANTIPAYDRTKDVTPPKQFNIVYFPALKRPPAEIDASVLFKLYDFDRSLRLLERLHRPHTGDGPYIVSLAHPLDASPSPGEKVLFQDLSTVPESLIKPWVEQFRFQTAQERWDRATLGTVAVRIRTYIELTANAYPEIKKSIESVISLQ
jgi:hypothetical protein